MNWIRSAVVMAVGGASVVVGLLGYTMVYKPRAVLRDFDAFVERHPVGSPVAELAADPFVQEAAGLNFDNDLDLRPRGGLEQSEIDSFQVYLEQPDGHAEIIWMHSPPFGRAIASFAFTGGKITEMKKGYLD